MQRKVKCVSCNLHSVLQELLHTLTFAIAAELISHKNPAYKLEWEAPTLLLSHMLCKLDLQ